MAWHSATLGTVLGPVTTAVTGMISEFQAQTSKLGILKALLEAALGAANSKVNLIKQMMNALQQTGFYIIELTPSRGGWLNRLQRAPHAPPNEGFSCGVCIVALDPSNTDLKVAFDRLEEALRVGVTVPTFKRVPSKPRRSGPKAEPKVLQPNIWLDRTLAELMPGVLNITDDISENLSSFVNDLTHSLSTVGLIMDSTNSALDASANFLADLNALGVYIAMLPPASGGIFDRLLTEVGAPPTSSSFYSVSFCVAAVAPDLESLAAQYSALTEIFTPDAVYVPDMDYIPPGTLDIQRTYNRTPPTTIAVPPPGYYPGVIELIFRCDRPRASVYYTVDGSIPHLGLTPWDGKSIRLDSKTAIRWFSVDTNNNVEYPNLGIYTVGRAAEPIVGSTWDGKGTTWEDGIWDGSWPTKLSTPIVGDPGYAPGTGYESGDHGNTNLVDVYPQMPNTTQPEPSVVVITQPIGDPGFNPAGAEYPILTIVTPNKLSTYTIGSAWSLSIQALGGIGPYSYTLTAGTLPLDLTLNLDGSITGTTTAGGNYTFTVTVADSVPVNPTTFSKEFTLAVVSALTLTTSSLADGGVNDNYGAQLVASGGIPPYKWTTLALPLNLALSRTTGMLSGALSPSILLDSETFKINYFDITITDSDDVPTAITPTLSLRVNQTAPATPTGLSVMVSAIRATLSWVNTANNVTGITIERATNNLFTLNLVSTNVAGFQTGYFDDTVVKGTTYYYRVRNYNVALNSEYSSVATAVIPSALVSTASVVEGHLSTVYDRTLTATGGVAPYIWEVNVGSTLPAGLSIFGSSIIGTPTELGTFMFDLKLTDSDSPASVVYPTFTLTVTPQVLAISTSELSIASVNGIYDDVITVVGGVLPYVWSATGLPSGITIDVNTGILSGTIPASIMEPNMVALTFNPTITVHDSAVAPATVIQSISIIVNQTAPTVPTNLTAVYSTGQIALDWINTANNEIGIRVERALDQEFTSELVVTNLVGTTLVSHIDSTVLAATTYYYRLQIYNSLDSEYSVVATNNFSISTASLAEGTIGELYEQQMVAVGGVAPLTWSATGLPDSMSIDPLTGIISKSVIDPLIDIENPVSVAISPDVMSAALNSSSYPIAITVLDSSFTPLSVTANLSLVINQSIPLPPTLMEPSGTITDSTPTYKWEPVDNAVSYSFYSSFTGVTTVYTHAAIYNGTTSLCEITPATTLTQGTNVNWMVASTNGKGTSAFGPANNIVYVP